MLFIFLLHPARGKRIIPRHPECTTPAPSTPHTHFLPSDFFGSIDFWRGWAISWNESGWNAKKGGPKFSAIAAQPACNVRFPSFPRSFSRHRYFLPVSGFPAPRGSWGWQRLPRLSPPPNTTHPMPCSLLPPAFRREKSSLELRPLNP